MLNQVCKYTELSKSLLRVLD